MPAKMLKSMGMIDGHSGRMGIPAWEFGLLGIRAGKLLQHAPETNLPPSPSRWRGHQRPPFFRLSLNGA